MAIFVVGVCLPPTARSQEITNPAWIVTPTPTPPAFATMIEVEGRVQLDCWVTEYGHLDDCEVREEQPVGLGFGRAGLESAASGLLRPRTVDGEPMRGRVRFVLAFSHSDDDEPEPNEDDPGAVDLTETAQSASPRARELARRIAKQLPALPALGQVRVDVDEDRRGVVQAWVDDLFEIDPAVGSRVREGMLLYMFDEAGLEAMAAGARPRPSRELPRAVEITDGPMSKIAVEAATAELRRRYCARYDCGETD